MMRREAPCIATPISTSCSFWLPSMWWWPSPAGSTMKAPTSKPSSAEAGPSSGSRWPLAGCVCSYTWQPWSLPSAVPLGSSPCEEDLSRPAGWKWRALKKCPRGLSRDWCFVKSWLVWVSLKKAFRGGKKSHPIDFLIRKIKRKNHFTPKELKF